MVESRVLPRGTAEQMQSEQLDYSLYCSDSELGDLLERLLGGLAVQRVRSRGALVARSASTRAAVVGITACSDGEIAWLRSNFGPLSPPCVVVAHLSAGCVRRLYPLRSGRLRVIWLEEAESRLVEVLEGLGRTHRGPMWRLGVQLLSDPSLRPSVRETISRVCGLHDDAGDTPFIPETSVGRLARRVHLATPTLRQYWREEVPLRCNLKEFLSWAILLWALRARSRNSWNAIADRVGLQRRTLQRNFNRLAGCTLAEAAEDPKRVVARFNEWVDSVWNPRSGNGPAKYDQVRPQAPVGWMS